MSLVVTATYGGSPTNAILRAYEIGPSGVVQDVQGTGSTVTFPTTPAPTSILAIELVLYGTTPTVASVSDPTNGAWTLGGTTSAGNMCIAGYYTSAGGTGSLLVCATNSGVGTGPTVSVAMGATIATFVAQLVGNTYAPTGVPGSPWVNDTGVNQPGVLYEQSGHWVGSTGTQAYTGTTAGSTQWIAVGMAFIPPPLQLTGTGAGRGSGSAAVVVKALILTGTGPGVGSGTATVAQRAALTGTGAGVGAGIATVVSALVLTGTGAGIGSGAATVISALQLTGTGAGVGSGYTYYPAPDWVVPSVAVVVTTQPSDKFKAAITGSHRVAGYATVAGVPLVVDASASSVTVDWTTAAPTRTGSLTLMDPTGDLTPSDARSLLHPLSGNELVIVRGIEYDDGSRELVPCGVFCIKTSDVADTAAGGDLVIKVTAADRSYRMSRAKLPSIYPLTAGVDLGTTIQTLLASRVPSTVFNFAPVTYLMSAGQVLIPGDDPWAQAKKLATDAGCLLDYDVDGICFLIPMPDPTVSAIAATYLEGPLCTVTQGTRLLTNVGVFNHTVREGSGSTIGAPVRGEWWDTNPLSATYWTADNDIVDYKTSSLWTTQAQAQVVAEADGLASLGAVEAATLSIFPDPARAPLDVVKVGRGRMNIDSYYVLDRMTIPFSSAADMQINGRLVHR